ncbi:hypothetical protein HAX54_000779 [Datura stramonium]|uniref:Uncharacterized protein n=1 Tax=Datura stramonium TaxID=4076 RepID=A0ABS8T2B9_DATST|nr:hypothetical protein [Datura stramonium]
MNKSLKMKLEELGVAFHTSWHPGEQSVQPEGFFQHVDWNNTLTIRYDNVPQENEAPSTHDATGVVPGWML